MQDSGDTVVFQGGGVGRVTEVTRGVVQRNCGDIEAPPYTISYVLLRMLREGQVIQVIQVK